MSGQGKAVISYKKEDFGNQRSLGIGFKNMRFVHTPNEGDTFIDLLNLTKPSDPEWVTFVNPSVAELLEARLTIYRDNVQLMRSAGGKIMPYAEFSISTNSRIDLNTPALVNEVFYGEILYSPKSGLLAVDGRKIVQTGVLASGETDITVDGYFAVNTNPLQQLGEVLVVVDGMPFLRNVNNATAAPAANGNYEEVSSGGGLSNVIRLNNSESYDRNYMVMSVAVAVQRPDGSRDAVLETIAATLDKMIPVLSDASGQPESYFQVAPNYPDLLRFGEEVSENTQLRPVIEKISANYIIKKKDRGKIFLASGDTDFTMPNPADYIGHSVRIKRNDSVNDIDLLQYGSEDIEGIAAKFTITNDGEIVEFAPDSDGNWWRIR